MNWIESARSKTMKSFLIFSGITLLGMLAIVGWQQANSLRQEMAIKELAFQDRSVSSSLTLQRQEATIKTMESDYGKLMVFTDNLSQELAQLRNKYDEILANPIIIIQEKEVVKEVITPLKSIENVNWDYLLYKLVYAQQSHQYYVDHPLEQNKGTGDTEWNQKWVEIYQLLHSIILEIKEKQ